MRFPTFLVFGIIRLLSHSNPRIIIPETPGNANDYQGSWSIKSIVISVVVVSIISFLIFKN